MKLPPKVHEKAGRYYYVHRNKWHGLSRVAEGEAALLDALRKHLTPKPTTYNGIFDAWIAAEHRLAPATLAEYRAIVGRRLRRHFGRVGAGALMPPDVAQYLELRGGVKANREIATLSTICAWAMRKGWLPWNPCYGVRRNPESPRKRYVTDAELAAALEQALPAVRDILEAAYLTGLRQGDLRRLRQSQLGDDGIHVTEAKRGRQIVISWSPPLRQVVQRALARQIELRERRLKNKYRGRGPADALAALVVLSPEDRVFTSTLGRPWTASGLQSALKRLGVAWTFHDLRGKAESDHAEGLGLLARYQRARVLKPVR